jgi:hypothetical protein
VANVAANLDHRARELVAERHRGPDPVCSPVVPVEDVQIGPAKARSLDSNEDVVVATDWNRRFV